MKFYTFKKLETWKKKFKWMKYEDYNLIILKKKKKKEEKFIINKRKNIVYDFKTSFTMISSILQKVF